jgi:hypothetical protein
MSNTTPEQDPFAQQAKRESVSWKTAKVGDVQAGTVLEVPKLVQARDYESGDPVFWDPNNKGRKTTTPNDQPVKTVVVALAMTEGPAAGEERSLWAQKPSALFNSFGEATKKLGRPIRVGDKVSVKFSGEQVDPDPERAKKRFPQKLYAVKVEAGPEPDAFGGGEEPPPF